VQTFAVADIEHEQIVLLPDTVAGSGRRCHARLSTQEVHDEVVATV
jgi:hypothetical protein